LLERPRVMYTEPIAWEDPVFWTAWSTDALRAVPPPNTFLTSSFISLLPVVRCLSRLVVCLQRFAFFQEEK